MGLWVFLGAGLGINAEGSNVFFFFVFFSLLRLLRGYLALRVGIKLKALQEKEWTC